MFSSGCLSANDGFENLPMNFIHEKNCMSFELGFILCNLHHFFYIIDS